MSHEPFDADMARYLAEAAKLGPAWDPDWPMARRRIARDENYRLNRASRPAHLLVEDIAIDGLHARIYRPPGEAPKPGVLYAHGGGWAWGSCETHDDITAEIADQADVVTVAFDYRLAPEHRHPAQIEDAARALDWMRSAGRALGIDPGRIVAAGDSAGGQIAAGLALKLKAAGQPQLRGLVLINPALGGDTETASYLAHAASPTLQRAHMVEYLDLFLGPRGSANWQDPIALPNLAQDVSGLPPAFISVAGHDPLHDDGVIFRDKLKAAGIAVALRHEPALAHTYIRARHASTAAGAGFAAIIEAVRHLGHEGSLPQA
jgi:acetyl esterase